MGNTDLDLIKRDVVDVVTDRIHALVESKEILLPTDYSVENAMKSAWLMLQTTKTKDEQPVLAVCSKNSIANSLLDMAVQGLNPAKEQCYFIAYGKTLTCQRSYFGSMHLVRRILPGVNIYHAAVYEGDEFEYVIEKGRKRITVHKQTFANVAKGKVLGAYCVIEPGGDQESHAEVMTIDQIKQAWEQGPNYREGGKPGVHQKFEDQMAMKTVIQRACKFVINTSSDEHLLRHLNRVEEETAEAAMEAEVEAHANGEVIDVEPENERVEPDPAETPEEPGTGGSQEDPKPEIQQKPAEHQDAHSKSDDDGEPF